MLSPLRNRFGIPGVISVIALVFAMFGGAYAATNPGGDQATSSAKAKKSLRGPRGPQGPEGPAGPAGAKGEKGDSGSNGKGAEAVSFTGKKEIGTVKCEEGGLEVKSASGTTLVCNGKKGDPGKKGKSGFTEVLPAGKTETGTWSFGAVLSIPIPEGGGAVYGVEGLVYVPISFPIPLVEPLGGSRVHYVNPAGKEVNANAEEVDSTACTGSTTEPTAEPGHLCVYAKKFEKVGFFNSGLIFKPDEEGAQGASIAGAVMWLVLVEGGASGFGTWAVTAEE